MNEWHSHFYCTFPILKIVSKREEWYWMWIWNAAIAKIWIKLIKARQYSSQPVMRMEYSVRVLILSIISANDAQTYKHLLLSFLAVFSFFSLFPNLVLKIFLLKNSTIASRWSDNGQSFLFCSGSLLYLKHTYKQRNEYKKFSISKLD